MWPMFCSSHSNEAAFTSTSDKTCAQYAELSVGQIGIFVKWPFSPACAIRLTGFPTVGMAGGNIIESGTRGLCDFYVEMFAEVLQIIT
jgi:hypothetical protein